MPHPSPTQGRRGWLGSGLAFMDEDRNDRWIASRAVRRAASGTARSLRKQSTASETTLWDALRGRKLGGRKFRRQQSVGPTCWTSTVRRNGWQSRLTVGYTAASKRQTGS